MAIQEKEKESRVQNGKIFPRNMGSQNPMGGACIKRRQQTPPCEMYICIVVKFCESYWWQNWMASISTMGEKNVFAIFQGKELVSLSKLYHPTSKK
jgi:hypothetical protein